MDILINGCLFVLLPVIGIVVFLRLGWKAGVKFLGILALPLFLLTGVAYYFIGSLSSDALRALGIGIVALAFLYLFGRSFVYYFNRQAAGKPTLGEYKSFSPLLSVTLLVYFLGGLFLFIPLLLGSENSVSGLLGASLILLAELAIVRRMDSFEIRERGILSGQKFFSWADIESVKWDHLLRKEKLNIKMKSLDRIYQVKVPWDQHLAVADFIKQKYLS